MCSRKRGSIFFALKTLHIYYTTGLPLESSERLNNALHLLYPVDCDLFRPCVYYTTGLPTINPIYLLYHRVVIWWHVHYTAGWQTFSRCTHRTTQITRFPPERLNDAPLIAYRWLAIWWLSLKAPRPLYPRPKDVEGAVSAPERLSGASLVSYRGGCVWWLQCGRLGCLRGLSRALRETIERRSCQTLAYWPKTDQ